MIKRIGRIIEHCHYTCSAALSTFCVINGIELNRGITPPMTTLLFLLILPENAYENRLNKRVNHNDNIVNQKKSSLKYFNDINVCRLHSDGNNGTHS